MPRCMPRRPQYFWERQNSRVSPHGRWCVALATCGSRVLLVGGSTDFRVSADETWLWQPTPRSVEDPSHPPSFVGEWTRLYGTDPFDDMRGGRPAGAGPLRVAGYSVANAHAMGQSDIVLLCACAHTARAPPRACRCARGSRV